ncbi:hypothetical protein [Pygmaiobacter massiliensis]|uniref:hypothetical protein n=1 Tax=Pygmaiobacter massiliensis TaxID=1917873 RepID=UPI000C7CE31F|nr:hypothetical protein [Pygmaiobacter massiliensis]
MKRFGAAILATFMAATLVGCGGSAVSSAAQPSTTQSSATSNISSTGQGSQKETITEQLLYEENGLKVTAEGLEFGGMMGPEVTLLIENTSDVNVTVQAAAVVVNGYTAGSSETVFSSDVAAGKKTRDSIKIMNSMLDVCDIETITDVSFKFHVFNTDTWDTIADSERVTLETSSYGEYTQTYNDEGQLLYEENGVKIVYKGLSKDSFMGPEILLYIENNSEQSITVQQANMSVNGFMVDGIMSAEVVAGTKAMTGITIMETKLQENKITELENVELSFHVFNTDTWNTVFDTAPIGIQF